MISIVIYVRFLFLCVCLLSFQRLLVNGPLLIWRSFFIISQRKRAETKQMFTLFFFSVFYFVLVPFSERFMFVD